MIPDIQIGTEVWFHSVTSGIIHGTVVGINCRTGIATVRECGQDPVPIYWEADRNELYTTETEYLMHFS